MKTKMFTLKTARTYRNYLKSVLKYNVPLQCCMSNNSKHFDDIINIMQKKSPLDEKKKKEMTKAKKVFELVKGDAEVKKCDVVEQPVAVDLNVKMKELIRTAEAVPLDSSDSVQIQTAESTPGKHFGTQNKAKNEFLDKAKQVALALGVDVEITQKELFLAFQKNEGEVSLSGPGFSDQYEHKPKEQKIYTTNTKITGILSDTQSAFNIFKKKVHKEMPSTLQTWNYLKKVTLLHSNYRPPRNYFEEQINWTQQGKLWHFPIDNEQGWDEEIATDFTEHVFLDKHLEPWCPKSGPIRHFMELVTTGLSKNPYLSAKRKKEHILWYRDYFQSKSKLLNELGVLDKQIKDVEKLQAGENKS